MLTNKYISVILNTVNDNSINIDINVLNNVCTYILSVFYMGIDLSV